MNEIITRVSRREYAKWLAVAAASCALLARKSSAITPAQIGAVAGSRRRSYVARAAIFDGTNDYIRRSGAITGLADAKTFTFSCWVKFGASNGALRSVFRIAAGATNKIAITFGTDDKLSLFGRNAANSTILTATGSTSVVVATGWVHVFVCIDMDTTATRFAYVTPLGSTPSAETMTWTVYTEDGVFDLAATTPVSTIGSGADPTPAERLNATLSELWFDDTYNTDTAKFIEAGYPKNLGAAGETPTGTSPSLYLSRSGGGNSWATDSSGNSNTYTVTGGLGEATLP